jgi:uncharacterized protein
MLELWIPISEIHDEGEGLTFADQVLWHEAWKEFSLPVEPARDLEAVVTIMPQGGDGALIRGTLRGSVKLVCDRCTELFEFDVDVNFDIFEKIPDEEIGEEPRVRELNGELQLDIGAILWEEFLLALPVKPLCSEGCKGVCSGCGKDLNSQKCECNKEIGDERLAVFRNLKIK